jgi:hypothetical protein
VAKFGDFFFFQLKNMTLLLLLLLGLLQAFLRPGARINVSNKEELFCFKLDMPSAH